MHSKEARKPDLRSDTVIYSAIALLVLCAQWISSQGWYTPWSRTGYWLGVAGGVAMLTLFTYPLRKRLRLAQAWGPAKRWFNLHMVLGILGPWLILLHSGFHIGSTNAAVALYTMLIVAASGVIGRFLYVRLNAQVRGQRVSIQLLTASLKELHQSADQDLQSMPEVVKTLHAFEDRALNRRSGVLSDLLLLPWQRVRVEREAGQVAKHSLEELARLGALSRTEALNRYKHAKRVIREHNAAVLKAAQFQSFEKLFSLWHVAHVPFVWIMVLCAIFHVIAVHAY